MEETKYIWALCNITQHLLIETNFERKKLRTPDELISQKYFLERLWPTFILLNASVFCP